jgi:ATP phosphoribosyltransferase regulatory subunit
MIAPSGPGRRIDALRIAVPKGALFVDSVEMLDAAGVPVGGLREPGRQLVLAAGNGADAVEFVIGKPTDIPAYVAYGAVDAGIAGKDALVEADLDVVEMVDLRFGRCRFVVAEPVATAETTAERYGHVGVMRIATKYPVIAEAHFARKGVQVEIVRLSGNIEIAPLIGMADQIVDITATGRTLRENDLRIVEDVLPSTARFVANPISLRTKAARVTSLATRLSEVACGEEAP